MLQRCKREVVCALLMHVCNQGLDVSRRTPISSFTGLGRAAQRRQLRAQLQT